MVKLYLYYFTSESGKSPTFYTTSYTAMMRNVKVAISLLKPDQKINVSFGIIMAKKEDYKIYQEALRAKQNGK